MKASKWLLPTLMILAQIAARTDGGTVQLRKEAGDLLITLFTLPAPLSVGTADISLLLQNRNSLEPVLDANISLVLRADDSGPEFTERPTRERARNKLLYATPVMFPKPGNWQIAVTIEQHGQQTSAVGVLEVTPGPVKPLLYSIFVAFPPLMVALFALRERLIRREARR